MSHGGHTYYKIPVDLNEGAGGKWIYYLYYRYIWDTGKPSDIRDSLIKIIKIDAISQALPILSISGLWEKEGTELNGNWTDLNEGAGGKYVKLQALHWHSYIILHRKYYHRHSCHFSFQFIDLLLWTAGEPWYMAAR